MLVLGRANAGNQDSFALGNEAALNGGAVAATAEGPDAVWYNPAGLARATKSSLDLTATAFALRQRRIPGGSVLLLQDGSEVSENLTSRRVLVVPTSLATARKVGEHVMFGAGVFVPELDQWRFEQKVGELRDAEGSLLRHRADIQGSSYRYDLGASLAWAVTPSYRIGISLFGVYEALDQIARFWWNVERAPDSASVLLGEERRALTRQTADSTIALQADLSDTLHLGFVLKAPRLLLRQTLQGDNILSGAFNNASFEDSPQLVFHFSDVTDTYRRPALLSPVAPPRGLLGLGYDYGRGTLSIEADVSPSLSNPRAGLAAKRAFNGRFGATYQWDHDLTFGGGIFTDRSQSAAVSGFPSFRVDYYGAALGVKVGKPLKLDEKGRRELVFETTVGARYALGLGQASAITFDFRPLDRGDFQVGATRKTDVLFQEMSLHVGSGLSF